MEDFRLYTSAVAHFRRKLTASLLPLAAILAAGCSSHEGNLRLVSLDQKHSFSQTFSQAYISRNESGDADIVLVQDSVQPVHHDSSKPQPPDASVMPRELVHIRVFWTPMNGVKADHPANTNASIHWCFVCDNSNQVGTVEYCGSGLVVVNNSSSGATITVRKAWMKERCQHGQLTDPIGPSLLYGSFRATRDDAQVKSIIAQIKSAANNTDEAQASTVSPVN
jgi:uncharacterized protein YcfL